MRIQIGMGTAGQGAAGSTAAYAGNTRNARDAQDTDGQEALVDLYEWLRTDPDVRRETTLSLTPAHRPGTMSSTAELVDMALTHLFSAANFVLAYAAWRHARKQAPPSTFTAPETGGSITVYDASEESLRRLREWLDETSASASSPAGEQDDRQDAAPNDAQNDPRNDPQDAAPGDAQDDGRTSA
jgi:hypothetical protein